ncbi:phosphatidylserine/phosphatidylglycerophosphate/cardiolipin synthase family protein [Sulfobacillus acidophilus]|uniref:Phosphatidylserine/phosphatidylglycerophosphate/ cardiolipin synthase family protein n=1 Tax=Sulfobacillus acidophilus TaxID=53633 RepID=A0ABS3AWK3_9FIRM|nr:phosphatidylserine/phosphatidylglycerophosphate/cardiolipin synthase family protein [Sulfobacillus acidophilus]
MKFNNLVILSIIFLLAATSLSGCVSFRKKLSWANAALNEPNVNSQTLLKKRAQKFNNFHAAKQNHIFLSKKFQRKLDESTNSTLSAGNSLALLPNKKGHTEKIKLIKKAEKSIYMATLQIVCDKGGEEFTENIIKASKRGVDIRIVLDGGFWGSFGQKCLNKMKEHGVKIKKTPYEYWPWSTSWQLHDKIFITDAKYAITGGQNIGSWWSESNGLDDNFKDTDVYAEGPVVLQMALRFFNIWMSLVPKDKDFKKYLTVINKKRNFFKQKKLVGEKNYKKWLKQKNPKGLCRFVAQDPHLNTFYVFDAYTLLTTHSKGRIVFHVPSLNALGSKKQEKFRKALIEHTKKQNGRVDIITNGPGLLKSRIVPWPAGNIYGFFTLNRVYDSIKGTELNTWAYHHWLHSKVYYFDALVSSIGSFNFDDSGLSWTESTLICIDPKLIKEVQALLKSDFAHSKKLKNT